MQPGTSIEACKTCNGVGQIVHRQGFFTFAQVCNACGGEGYTIPSPCKACAGRSRVQKYDTLSVTIPKGIFDGAEFALEHKGDAGVYGGPAGNLYIKVTITPDKKFKRVDDDIECTVVLTYPQLVFGCHIEIENIDGSKEALKVPKGTAVGERLLIPGKGFPRLRTRGRGDLVVITNCDIPKRLPADATKALEQYAEAIGDTVEGSDSMLGGFFKRFLG